MRIDQRANDALRPVVFTRNYIMHPAGAVLVEMGHTKVICTASVEEKVPGFLKGKGSGWVTAEYSMLPGSTGMRKSRNTKGIDGRSQEIQRLIGRSLRSVVDLEALGERTIWIDCDVIQADGGTRTASITGAFVALNDAVNHLIETGALKASPIRTQVAAVSVGIVGGEPMLDLCYEEDSCAQVDMNVIMTGEGEWIELQGTGEERPFTQAQLMTLLELGSKGVQSLIEAQTAVMPVRQQVVLASNNAHKVDEIKSILAPLGYDVLSMKDIGLGDMDIEETGTTFSENALIKARAVAEKVDAWVLADDSGLEVDYLNGAPGVYSARYAGEPKCDARNNLKLLSALKDLPREERKARFVTVLTLLTKEGDVIETRGEVLGTIGTKPMGENGFGYDPLFFCDEVGKTFAQLSASEKNALSHRARALNLLKERLLERS